MIVVLPPAGVFAEHAGEPPVKEVWRLVGELESGALRLARGRHVGDVESNLEERDSLENDLAWATAICILLVCAVVVGFYGRFRAIALIAAPALLGTRRRSASRRSPTVT